ncbi:DEAD/DEAH box helicase [Cryobacterium sp. TMT2-15-1]|uniref:DEAD/DEAH box helicase n=1 Tax=Cryobacterium sp. TMT2-15-1 TaxID=1259246 RepID=UPI00141B5245|nr:DEAD/DEAH box helicase [Cryobacterium sp. TMT2-15-1]
MAFKQRSAPELTAATPEQLFQLLPRTGKSVASLWSHQADILRDYAQNFSTSRDLAIELPTGTGKTLPGLLIADWRRRSKKGRTVFACPTVQLVRQVVSAAKRQGIPVVDLSGSAKYWDTADKVKFESGRATAVVTYSSIFNVNPKITNPDLIIFDDAHAGEQYVTAAYTVNVDRGKHAEIYEDLIEALREGLNKELIMNTPSAGTRRSVDVVFPVLNDDWLGPLDAALSKLGLRDDKAWREQSFRYGALRGHLSACSVYITWDEISIRPLVPPTFENSTFSQAAQRIYLSATLGSGGELERAFGRPAIKRLSLPESAGRPKSGRRFVVFPQMVQGADPEALSRTLIELAGKAIVITPSDFAVSHAEAALVPANWAVFHRSDVEDSFDAFAASSNSLCILANRYDGIDLPGSACRAVVLYGHPNATHLQERFLASRARASAAIDERVRSRVVQGTGRCTRGPEDWAVVIVADPDTTTYLSRPEVQSALDEDLQAEVRFGLEQSETAADELIENVRVFLEQGEAWLTEAEPILSEYRSEVVRRQPDAAVALEVSASYEVLAVECAWHDDWQGAGENFHAAAESLSNARSARGYHAMELFLAAVYLNAAGRRNDLSAVVKAADGLADRAVLAATPATWMKGTMPLPGQSAKPKAPSDAVAIRALAKAVRATTNSGKHDKRVLAMHEGLADVSHTAFEPALSMLGDLLGANAWKPDGDGRADSVWCWDNELWMTLEAKSEHKPEGAIGLDDVRQTNHHLEFLAADLNAGIPPGSVSIMISPKDVFKSDAMVIAEAFTYKVDPETMRDLALSAERLWKRLITLRNIADDADREDAVEGALTDMRLLPSDVVDRLSLEPIRGS